MAPTPFPTVSKPFRTTIEAKREWMGIEPTWLLFRRHTGFEAQDGPDTNGNDSNELREGGNPTGPLTGSKNLQLAQIDADLSWLVDAWPMVPAQIRAEILATVESHVDTDLDGAQRVARLPSTGRIPKVYAGVARPKTT